MKKVFLAFMVVCAFLSFSAAAHAGTILIHNETGFTIMEVYISDSGTDNWEEDVLGQNVLEAGDVLRVTVHGSYEEFDLMVSDDEGTYVHWYGLPGNASEITIYADGTAEYR